MSLENNLKVVKRIFRGNTRKSVTKQIEKFYDAIDNYKQLQPQYKNGDEVKLSKGTFLHGIIYDIDNTFNFVVENGFVATDFSGVKVRGKYPYTIGFWNINNDILLKDYIILYSGMTVRYFTQYNLNVESQLIPYKQLDSFVEEMKKRDYRKWEAEQTKEIRFLPSLAKDTNQIAFILNMDSEYAKELLKGDIFKKGLTKKELKPFIDCRTLEKFMTDERDAFFTNRESAIIFGLPICFVEGILVGREYENSEAKIKMIKNKMPNSYICNLDGIVISE